MRGFLKIVFGVVVGFFLSILLLFFLFAGIGSSGDSSSKKINANSVLNLKLKGTLPDIGNDDPFANVDPFAGTFDSEVELGLTEVKEILTAAEKDDKIKGILLNTDALSAMPANAHDLRRALEKFKKSGKFIYAYSDNLSEQSIFLNSAADKSYINPMGYAEFNGISSEVMYYTGLFEKLDIKPMIFYAGEFKSATEPFRLKAMSPENRLQVETFIGGIYNNYLSAISKSKKVSVENLKSLANNMDVFLAEDLVKHKLIDGVKYEDEVLNLIKSELGYKEDADLNLVSVNDFKAAIPENKGEKSKNKIAVIYAEGNIEDGKGSSGSIGGETYVKLLQKVRKDKDVKAIVLRVNSPGGSAFASELILRELKLAQDKVPVVVSMGNLAASGGYYIAANADKIIAEPTTITGSIGVYGMMFNVGDALKSKLGITTDRVKTGQYADFGSMTREWDDTEKAKMTMGIQKIYSTFLSHVAKGRKMTVEQVDQIARGRVWLGEDAVKIGLVDTLGSLDLAIAEAGKLAKIEKYEVAKFPEPKSTLDKFMEMITGTQESETIKAMQSLFGAEYDNVRELLYLKNQQGIQARMPFYIRFK